MHVPYCRHKKLVTGVFAVEFATQTHSHTQSHQACWSVGGCRERLWGNGMVTAGILQLMALSFVTVNSSVQPIKK